MTNFDFLKDTNFQSFAAVAIVAEKVFHIDFASSVINCRKAAEFAIKWMYSVDGDLIMPYQDNLVTLLNTDEFRKLIGIDLYRRLDFIRKLGNLAVHNNRNISREQAGLCLENLHVFFSFIAHCYAKQQTDIPKFDLKIASENTAPVPAPSQLENVQTLTLLNQSLKAEIAELRKEREKSFVGIPINPTEATTRKAYIDVMLTDGGWIRGKNWIDEYRIEEMPNASGYGFADYVLLGDNGVPLAVVEAKKTSVDVAVGRQQAKLYADWLEKKFRTRPIIFLTNGYDTRIWIDQPNGYPERPVTSIYSKKDLEKEFHKLKHRSTLSHLQIHDDISGRYYQKEAIISIAEAFEKRNRRKALLVMATGSGKTRTVISLVDKLMERGWVQNFLFLADRTSLVTQAKRAFVNLLPDLSITNLCESDCDSRARGVFSTYQTMINCIDTAEDEDGGKLFSCGHFDLIILDEAHRSIYNKYKDIFGYFDALLVGLTATPKNEIDKNTYEIFELESGVPDYGYDLARAVEDKYLVNYRTIETKLKFLDQGITYAELSEEEKAEYEKLFADETGNFPEKIENTALNNWIFNEDTIRQVLHILMTKGLKVEYGNKIGKTIIFAKSHDHAEAILKVWNKEYPHYPPHYCRIIDYNTNYAQSLIDDFSNPAKFPQIAISVDMLDTGIDVPEILNLVFFKKVMSKAKFWQMIGRGTRLCPGLIDEEDKEEFYIFDFCGVFDFFREKKNGRDAVAVTTLQEQLFNLKLELVFKLQTFSCQTNELTKFRKQLVDDLLKKLHRLNRDNFAVRQHLKFVDLFSQQETYQNLTFERILQAQEHVAPLIEPEEDEFTALRFDALIYGMELAYVAGHGYQRARNDLYGKLVALTNYGTIPEVKAEQSFIEALIDNIQNIGDGGIGEFEEIRTRLRELIKYIEKDLRARYTTNFKDDIFGVVEKDSELDNSDLDNYKKKVSHYIRQHEDNPVIRKLKTNLPLTPNDMKELEKILWNDLGTKADYTKEYGDMPLGELVRSIIGMDISAANQAFSQFITESNLDARQLYFIKQIINYIVKNGMMKDLSILQHSPFSDKGSCVDIFGQDLATFTAIKGTINLINLNAVRVAV